MTPASAPASSWQRVITVFIQSVRVRRSMASWALAAAQPCSWLTTSQQELGSTTRAARRLARAWPRLAITDPRFFGSIARKLTTSSSSGPVWRPRNSSDAPVTASSGDQPTPAASGRSSTSSVCTPIIRAVASARSRYWPAQYSDSANRDSSIRPPLIPAKCGGDLGHSRVGAGPYLQAGPADHGRIEHPGVLAPAALRAVHDQRALRQRHPGSPALGHVRPLAGEDERPQGDVTRDAPPVDHGG